MLVKVLNNFYLANCSALSNLYIVPGTQHKFTDGIQLANENKNHPLTGNVLQNFMSPLHSVRKFT